MGVGRVGDIQYIMMLIPSVISPNHPPGKNVYTSRTFTSMEACCEHLQYLSLMSIFIKIDNYIIFPCSYNWIEMSYFAEVFLYICVCQSMITYFTKMYYSIISLFLYYYLLILLFILRHSLVLYILDYDSFTYVPYGRSRVLSVFQTLSTYYWIIMRTPTLEHT